jgi:hypothetical protein
MQSLFPIDDRFLNAIARLKERNDIDFEIVMNKISEVSEAIDQQNLHSLPDKQMNYSERFHTIKGFGSALNVLKNIFANPEQLLVELKEQEDFLEAQEKLKEEGLAE